MINVATVLENKTLRLKIADNGNGFDRENTVAGNGLENMEHRANDIKGTLSIASETGKGTTVELFLKL